MRKLSDKKKLSNSIKASALRLGFDACGIAKSENLKEEAGHLKQYLLNNFHGEMQFLENNLEKRPDTSVLVEGSKSVVLVLLNYFTKKEPINKTALKISKYAYGKEYQVVMKAMLKNLLAEIRKENTAIEGRVFVDTAPIFEKALAARAGLGWIGKNSLLINEDLGSFIFIGELVINVELEYDKPIKNKCGNCTKCIDACPVNAIEDDRILNASKCISYYTIEKRTADFPDSLKNNMNNWIFGCDSCQDVCPYNKKAQTNKVHEFKPHPDLHKMDNKQWHALNEERFIKMFKDTPIERTGFSCLKRNIEFADQK